MKIYKGEEALDATWQDEFKPTMKCHKCKGTCRIMFTAMEDADIKKGDFICEMYENTGGTKGGKYWPHDVIAVAVYLCEKCFEPNAQINQA